MMKRQLGFFVLAGLLLGWLSVVPFETAGATGTKGTYPNTGYFNMDDPVSNVGCDCTQGFARVISNQCYSEEVTFESTAQKQLMGHRGLNGIPGNSQGFGTWWPYGIIFFRYIPGSSCKTTTIDNYTDDYIKYESQTDFLKNHTNVGGANTSTLAPTSWCQIWGITNPPCGYHISLQEVNLGHWTGYTSSYRVSFLFHETGHGMGWVDDCSAVSISNNGVACSFSGGYVAGDRTTLKSVLYKNSPYSKY